MAFTKNGIHYVYKNWQHPSHLLAFYHVLPVTHTHLKTSTAAL